MKNKTMEYKGFIGSVEVNLENDILEGKVLGCDIIVSYSATNLKELREEFKKAVDTHFDILSSNPSKSEEKVIDLFECLSDTEKQQSKLRGIIAAAVENKRHKLGLLPKSFAKKFNIDIKTLVEIENAEANLPIDYLIELLEKLNIKYSIVIGNVQNRCSYYYDE